MNKLKVEIDMDEVAMLVDRGGEFVINPNAELAILRLMEMQEILEEAMEAIKARVQEEGMALGDGFKGVQGDRISAICRQYGAKYGYRPEFAGELKGFLKEKVSATVDSEAVEQFIKLNGGLPRGIFENDRDHKLSISLKKERER